MTEGDVRHDATYSKRVVEIFRRIVNSTADPVEGPIVDPFAGKGESLDLLGRDDITGIELEPYWSDCSPLVAQGDALDRAAYPDGVKTVLCSPCYGNRFADRYLGKPCPACEGVGLFEYETRGPPRRSDLVTTMVPPGDWLQEDCSNCSGSGRDPEDQKRRFSYAISLGREASEGSACHMPFWNDNKGAKYRVFHGRWLSLMSQVLPSGPNRLILNMSDHFRTVNTPGGGAQMKQYACQWWLDEASRYGFRLVHAEPAYTQRFGFGANQRDKPSSEMVFVFDLAESGPR